MIILDRLAHIHGRRRDKQHHGCLNFVCSLILHPLFFSVIDIKEVVDMVSEMRRYKLGNVIFHELLDPIRHLRKALVTQIVIPFYNLDPRSFFCLLFNPLATSSSEAPVATNALNSSEGISAKLKKKLSRGQSKWYSPAVPTSVARHLSRVRPARTYPARVSRGLRGKSLERSFARVFTLFVSIGLAIRS